MRKFWTAVRSRKFNHQAFRAERLKRGISAKDVALKAGLSPQFLSDVECGWRVANQENAQAFINALEELTKR